MNFKSYSRHKVSPLGVGYVNVKTLEIEKLLKVYVCAKGPSLILREWLREMYPRGTMNIFQLSVEGEIIEITEKFKEVFSKRIGHLKNANAHINVKSGAVPRFTKTRPVSLHRQELVDEALKVMEKEGVIKKVTHSEWGAPIVCPLKKDESIRVCADFSTGLNASIAVERHPLPRIEDMLSKLTGERHSLLLV